MDEIDVRRYSGSSVVKNFSPRNEASMKKIWQGVLKECHRIDTTGKGFISRHAFITALENAKIPSKENMSARDINMLADTYTSATNGLIDYQKCFRYFLGDITSKAMMSSVKRREKNQPQSSLLLPDFTTHSSFYGYGDEKLRRKPLKISGVNKEQSPIKQKTDSHFNRSATTIKEGEGERVLKKYSPTVIDACTKISSHLKPVWRELRQEMKKEQSTLEGYREKKAGLLPLNVFLSTIERRVRIVDKNHLGAIVGAFRDGGMRDDIRYDDFLRVCLLVKADHS